MAVGISKFPFNRVLTCLSSSSDSGVNIYNNLLTGSMFLTIPIMEQNDKHKWEKRKKKH